MSAGKGEEGVWLPAGTNPLGGREEEGKRWEVDVGGAAPGL